MPAIGASTTGVSTRSDPRVSEVGRADMPPLSPLGPAGPNRNGDPGGFETGLAALLNHRTGVAPVAPPAQPWFLFLSPLFLLPPLSFFLSPFLSPLFLPLSAWGGSGVVSSPTQVIGSKSSVGRKLTASRSPWLGTR